MESQVVWGNWEKLFMSEINWKDAFEATKTATYLQSLQYKVMHNFTCTYIALVNMKIKQIYMCSFCHKDRETISHMFAESPYAKDFWSDREMVRV